MCIQHNTNISIDGSSDEYIKWRSNNDIVIMECVVHGKPTQRTSFQSFCHRKIIFHKISIAGMFKEPVF